MCAGSGNQTNSYRQISIDGTAAMIVGKELTCQCICLLNKRYYEINFLSMTVASLKTELRFLTKPTKVKQNKKCPTSTLSISDSDLSGTIFSRKVLLQTLFLDCSLPRKQIQQVYPLSQRKQKAKHQALCRLLA